MFTARLLCICAVFYTKGNDTPAVISLLLTLAGDVESNPGPRTIYTCPVCQLQITSTKRTRGSVQCNSCKEWIHTTCNSLSSVKQHHSTWACSRCPTTPNTTSVAANPTPITTTDPSTPSTPTPTTTRTTDPSTTTTSTTPRAPTPTNTPSHPNTPSPTQNHTRHTTPPLPRKKTINILQLNADHLISKKPQIEALIHQHKIQIAIIQETKLLPANQTPSIPGFSSVRTDRPDGQGGGLITYIHKDINYTDTTNTTQALFQNDTTLEIQSIRVNSGHKHILNIFNIYIPPVSDTVPAHYTPQLTPLTQIPNSIIAGDFNAKNTAWYTHNIDDRRGTDVATQLNNMFILNNPDKHTHIPYQAGRRISSPDITFCSTTLSSSTSWNTLQKLPSDHLPIIISTESYAKANNPHSTFTNYKKANWNRFTEETEQHFGILNNSPINNLNKHVTDFNNIILNADKQFIPKGNRRHYNPNFTVEINRLIKQRNDLKHKSPFPHSQAVTDRIQELNREINTKIQARKTEKWETFASTLNHSTNSSKIYRTLKGISNSISCSTKTHAAISKNPNKTPSLQEQANILINHYASISHLKPTRTPAEKRDSKHRRTFPLDHSSSPFTPRMVKNIIKKIKNSTSTGPDNICNLHLKHLGPQGIQALTNICNYSYSHCIIPSLWKKGKIITILKPNKDPTKPSSYRPITLLCTPSKIMELLVLNLISPYIPLAQSQHGFRPLHSTSTLLTNLTQQITDGINQLKPQRTLLTTIDISKAFDAMPRRNLINKINQTKLTWHHCSGAYTCNIFTQPDKTPNNHKMTKKFFKKIF